MRDAVLQQHAGHADRRQPIADLSPLQIDREDLIAAAGKNEHRGARVFSRRGIDGERGTRNVLDVVPRPAGDEVIGSCRGDLLGILRQPRAWSGSGPQRDFCLRSERTDHEKEQEQQRPQKPLR